MSLKEQELLSKAHVKFTENVLKIERWLASSDVKYKIQNSKFKITLK
jgi:hypothetical protein